MRKRQEISKINMNNILITQDKNYLLHFHKYKKQQS